MNLTVQTMYSGKEKSLSTIADAKSPASTSKTNSGTAFNKRISQDNASVNNQANQENKKFSMRNSAYLEAVENNDLETAQRLVEEAAKESGYNSPVLYHGTSAFGFTAFELSKMDDQRSIFLTDSNEIASTYSGVDGTRQINEKSNVDVDELSGKELAEYMNEYPPDNTVDYSYSFMEVSDVEKLREKVNKDIEYAKEITAEEISKFDNDSGEYHQLKTLQSALASKQLDGLSTKIYLALHYGESFRTDAKQSAKLNELEQNIRLLQKVEKISTLSSVVDTYDNGFIVEKALGGYSIEVLDLNDAKNNLNESINKGNYQLYAKTGNSLVVETNGANWNTLDYKIPDNRYEIRVNDNGDYEVFNKSSYNITWIEGKRAFSSYDEAQNAINTLDDKDTWSKRLSTTREVAEYAQKNGYDSVVFKDIHDNGGNNVKVHRDTTSDVYVVFNPNNVKSADPVTYDDNGNVIPLSERFNEAKSDIRYQARSSNSDYDFSKELTKTDYSDLTTLDDRERTVYNKRGWTCRLFSKEDRILLGEKFNELDNKITRKTDNVLEDGSKIVEVNNKIVLISGTFSEPEINCVLAINAANETEALGIKEAIFYEYPNYRKNKETLGDFLQYVQTYEEFVRTYRAEDFSYYKGQVDTGERATLPDNFKNYGYTKQFQDRTGSNSNAGQGVSDSRVNDNVDTSAALEERLQESDDYSKLFLITECCSQGFKKLAESSEEEEERVQRAEERN